MLINLTPHAIHIYAPDVPDRIDPEASVPQLIIEPSGQVARIGEIELGTQQLKDCPPVSVEYVEYRHITGIPPEQRPGSTPKTWYIVSLATALAAAGTRGDLLVPYREVRNKAGQVVGCRQLARPV